MFLFLFYCTNDFFTNRLYTTIATTIALNGYNDEEELETHMRLEPFVRFFVFIIVLVIIILKWFYNASSTAWTGRGSE